MSLTQAVFNSSGTLFVTFLACKVMYKIMVVFLCELIYITQVGHHIFPLVASWFLNIKINFEPLVRLIHGLKHVYNTRQRGEESCDNAPPLNFTHSEKKYKQNKICLQAKARGPFLERPGNLMGSKSHFEIKTQEKYSVF